MLKTFGLFAILALVCGTRVRADEAAPVESTNLMFKATLGVGGTVDAISSATVAQSAAASESRSRVSYGVGGQYTVPLLQHFAVGAAISYLSWRGAHSRAVGPRNWLLDFAVLPEARWKVSDSALLYVTVPFGVSLDMLNEIESDYVEGPSNPGFGFLVGGLVGTRFHIAETVGLFGELGYVYRRFSHELSVVALTSGLPTPERQDVTVGFGQLVLNLGLCVFL